MARSRACKSGLRRYAVGAALSLLWIAGIAGAQQAGDLVELSVAQAQDTTSVDPTARTAVETGIITSQLSEQLVRLSHDMEVLPALAESWTISDDQLTYTFNLREGVKFHDGGEFTAEDVKFTIERILDPDFGSTLAFTLAAVDRVEVIDPYTVSIALTEPNVGFIRDLGSGIWGIISKDAVERLGDEAFAMNPVGTGPYRFVEWVRDSHVTFEAFEDYWGGVPPVDRLTFRVIPEASTRLAALLAGEVDVVSGLIPDQVPLVDAAPNARIESAEGLFYNFLLFNTNNAPFDDVLVRRAVNHAINLDEIISGVYMGYATPMSGVFCSAVVGYDPTTASYEYDVARARQLLTEAGYPNGIDVKLEYPIGGGVTGLKEDVATVLQAQLAMADIRVTLLPRDAVQYSESIGRTPDIEHFSIGRTRTPAGDPDTLLKIYFDTTVRAFYLKDEHLEALVQEQGRISDEAVRLAKLAEINEYAIDQAVWGFLACPGVLHGVSERLPNWEPSPTRSMDFFNVEIR